MGVTKTIAVETPQDVVNHAYAVAHGVNRMDAAIRERDEFIREILRDLATDADPLGMMRYWFERAEKFGINTDGLDRERKHPAVEFLATLQRFLATESHVTVPQAEAHEADENPLTKGYADNVAKQLGEAWEMVRDFNGKP